MKQVVSVPNHQFTVGGDGDVHEVDVFTPLGRPGRSLIVYNNVAIALYFQYSTDGDDWSDLMHIPAVAGTQFRIYIEDGITIYKTRAFSGAINGYYSMQVFPGPDEKLTPNIRINEGDRVAPLDDYMPEVL
jgi:hypothetical protein